jgi:hypothetical protein
MYDVIAPLKCRKALDRYCAFDPTKPEATTVTAKDLMIGDDRNTEEGREKPSVEGSNLNRDDVGHVI